MRKQLIGLVIIIFSGSGSSLADGGSTSPVEAAMGGVSSALAGMVSQIITSLGLTTLGESLKSNPYTYAAGVAFVALGAAELAMSMQSGGVASSDKGTASYFKNRNSSVACETNPNDPACSHPNPNGGNRDGSAAGGQSTGGGTGQNLPPGLLAAMNAAKSELQKNGINIDDPKTRDDMIAKVQGMGPSGIQSAMNSLTPEQKAEFEKTKSDLMAKFGVTGVEQESGGGGRFVASHGSSLGGLDDLLKGLGNHPVADRGPASVEGLSKSFNGESIGLAGDNIFALVTRRYQSRISSKTFLPPSY